MYMNVGEFKYLKFSEKYNIVHQTVILKTNLFCFIIKYLCSLMITIRIHTNINMKFNKYLFRLYNTFTKIKKHVFIIL